MHETGRFRTIDDVADGASESLGQHGQNPALQKERAKALELAESGNLIMARLALLRVARQYLAEEHLEGALESFRDALRFGDDPFTRMEVSDICARLNNKTEALDHLRQGIHLQGAWDPSVGFDLMRRMAKLTPNSSSVMRDLADAAMKAGRTKLAKQAMLRAEQLLARDETQVLNGASLPGFGRNLSETRKVPRARVTPKIEGPAPFAMEQSTPPAAPKEHVLAALSCPAGIVQKSSLDWVDVGTKEEEVSLSALSRFLEDASEDD